MKPMPSTSQHKETVQNRNREDRQDDFEDGVKKPRPGRNARSEKIGLEQEGGNDWTRH